MTTEPVKSVAAAPLTAPDENEWRREERRMLRESQFQVDLQKLRKRHHEERQALLQEFRELAIARKEIQDRVWADWISSSIPDQQRKLSAELKTADRGLVELGEEAAAPKLKYEEQDGGAAAATALNGKEGPGEGDEESSNCAESSWKPGQQRDKEKQALLKELLPAKNELRLELQHLLKDLEEKALRQVYDHRIDVEDPREVKALRRISVAKRAGLWRFVSMKKVEAKRKVVEVEGSAEADIDYVDEEKLGHPRIPECYEEIKKLFDVEQNPFFSKTLQEWKQKKEWYILQQERNHNRVSSVKNEMYHVVGFASVFQGVLLTAVAQSSLLHCHNKWSPIALSVLASVISILGVTQKLNQIYDLLKNIDSEERDFTTAVRVVQLLQDSGPKGLDFVQLKLEIERSANRKSKLSKKTHLTCLYFVLVILTLIAFVVLFPISFWRILCKPGSPPAP